MPFTAGISAMVAASCMLAVPAQGSQAPHGDAYYNYSLSRQAWYRQDYDEALDHLRKAVAADPGSSELALDLARLHLELSQPEEAAKSARLAVDLAPSALAPLRVLADALFMIALRDHAGPDSLDEAYRTYSKVIELDPKDTEALMSLAKLQISKGDLKAALDSLQRHLKLAPNSDEAIFIAAQVLGKLNRLAEAAALLEGAAQRDPGNVQIGLALVDVYEARGDLEAAAAAARKLAKLQVDPIRVQFALARISQKMGKHVDAYGHFEEMARAMDAQTGEFSEGDRAEVQLRMVQSLLDAGRPDEALTQAEAGIRRFTADPRFTLRKGEALLVAGRSKEAEQLFREKIEAGGPARSGIPKQISDTYLAAAARKERTGEIGVAETLLRKSIDWDDQNAVALNYLGYMLADRGARLDEAIGLIRRALERDPKNGAYLDSLGWAYFKKQSYTEAEKALDEALAYMRDEPAIHDHLGDLYNATGRRDEAVKAWKEALDRGAENPERIRAKLGTAGASGSPP